MTTTQAKIDYLTHLGDKRPAPALSLTSRKRSKQIVFLHFDAVRKEQHAIVPRNVFAGLFASVALLSLLAFVFIRPALLLRQDRELTTLQSDLLSISIVDESFE